jgi:GNAT superfamily N-acetyltransferase
VPNQALQLMVVASAGSMVEAHRAAAGRVFGVLPQTGPAAGEFDRWAAKEVEVIRLASMSDVAGIRALMKSVTGFWDETWRADVLERALASSEAIALVHHEGQMIDGFACAHDAGFRAYLSELVVSPTSQGRGVGTRLLSELERRLADRGCSVVIADVWRDAEDFYRLHGWTTPAVVLLRKRLAATNAQPSAAPEPACV